MISCLGLCIVFGLTTTNCSVSNDIEQSPTPEQPKVAKYHNPIVSTSLPDPTVTKADDGYFYLYATENIRNLPIYRSKDLVNWNYVVQLSLIAHAHNGIRKVVFGPQTSMS